MADRLGPPDAGVKERIPMRSMKHQPARYLWPAAMLGAVAALQPASAAPADARSAAAVTVSSSSISRPQGIAAGPDGALWFTNQGTNSIGPITTVGTVAAFSKKGVHGIRGPFGITSGPDGALWFTINFDNNAIGRITTGGKITLFPNKGPYGASAITTGPDKAMWFTDGRKAIGRITTGANITIYTGTGIDMAAPTDGITAGPAGGLWFTTYNNYSIG